MNEIIQEFLKEAQRHLARCEEEFRTFTERQGPFDEAMSSLSQSLQAIRYGAAQAGLNRIDRMAEAAQIVVDRMSFSGEESCEQAQPLLQECLAALGEDVAAVARTGQESDRDYSPLFALIQQLGRPVVEQRDQPTDDARKEVGLTIHDVAALLVQIDAGNLADSARLADALRRVADRTESPKGVPGLLREAAAKLDSLADRSPEEADQLLIEIAGAIEIATRVEEGDEGAARTDSVQEEDNEEIVLPPDSDLELLGEFVTESREFIAEAESALLSLEIDPENIEAVNTVFRAFHTIKGTSGFLGLTPLTRLAHRAESLLSKVRNHEIRFTGSYADLALKSIDCLKGLVEQVDRATRGAAMSVPSGYLALLRQLDRCEEHQEFAEPADEPVGEHMRVGDILVAARKADRKVVDKIEAQKGSEPIGVALVRSKAASLTDVAKALRTQQRIASSERGTESSVRVRTERLDRLIDMVGELVIAQSMVAQDSTANDGTHDELSKKISHAGKIVRELQDLSMSMRMVPFRATFQRIARQLRDLSRKSGKAIDFETHGEDTEIDRNMVDLITDPLIHMVRNAVDHGIEPAEEREKNGKPPSGHVRLKAFHSGGNVVVELEDDGRGLDREKILQKALETGLIDSEKGLSDLDVYHLIFAPGFSTADQVTDVSGRGVGLDVVRRNVEALRGRIEINSSPGVGCKFSLRLPLTLAITDGMLVKVGAEHYIVPTVNIHLSFRPAAPALFTVANRGDLVMLRGELLPMFRLYRLFDVRGAIEDPTKGLLVVVGDGNRRCALLVDELLGQQQVVAKSLGQGLGKVQGISGGAILGDGRVGLILDTMEIVSLARQVGSGPDRGELKAIAAEVGQASL